jgi:hypothetical protein
MEDGVKRHLACSHAAHRIFRPSPPDVAQTQYRLSAADLEVVLALTRRDADIVRSICDSD